MLSTQPGIEMIGSAASGLEALALLETLVPDVILVDLRMSIQTPFVACQGKVERSRFAGPCEN